MIELHERLPKYVKIAEHLRRQMRAGVFKAGDRLPSLAQLNSEFGASQATVDRAHAMLEQDGLIVREQGRGVFVAEAPQRKATGVIGCVLPPPNVTLQFPYYQALTTGIRMAAIAAGVEVLLLNDPPSAGWEKVDGALIFGEVRSDIPQQLPIPMPLVGLMSPIPGIPCALADDYHGMRQAVEHLLQLGHWRIAYLSDADQPAKDTPVTHRRLDGYRDALVAHGIEPRPEWMGHLNVLYGEFRERGRDSMRDWLRDGRFAALGCTALLAQNDRCAIGAMETLRAAGYRVPDDISVVGFDGTPECDIVEPRLTSVEVPLQDIGAHATRMLLQLVAGQSGQDSVALPTRLQVRGSTAAPPV